MKILELALHAFGPFSGETLTFGPEPALHFVYGPNEAGKSTSLRAVSGLFYGIPERTQDAHRHPMASLRVGARLQTPSGDELEVVRRKGRRNTLLDGAGNTLDEAVLERLLAGVSSSMFSSMFGLNHRTLRDGARALLEGRGDVGESLFDAAGARGVHQVLRGLRDEADLIYRPRAQNPKLNETIKRLNKAREQMSLASVGGQAWTDQKKEHQRVRGEHADKLAERQRVTAERNRLERVLATIPGLTRRSEITAKLAELAEVRLLPPDARDRRTDAQRELTLSSSEIRSLEADVAALAERCRELEGVIGSIAQLDEAVIASLQDRLGTFRSARNDLPRRKGELQAVEGEIQAMLRSLNLGVDARLGTAEGARIEKLAAEHGGLQAALIAAERALTERRAKAEAVRRKIEELPEERDPTPLKKAVSRAARSGDVDATRGELQRQVEIATGRVERAAAALRAPGVGLPPHAEDVEALARLPLPGTAALDELMARLTVVRRDLEQLAGERAKLEQRSASLRVELEALELAGDVPTEEQLAESRKHRDDLFARLAERCLESGWEATAAAEYEEAVRAADQLADRLRREAERVASRARLMAELAGVARDEERLEAKRQERRHREEAIEAEHRALFAEAGIEAASPEAMREWLERHEALVRDLDARGQAAAQLAEVERQLGAHRQAVSSALAAVGVEAPRGEGLAPLLDAADAVAERLADVERRRRELAKASEDLAVELSEAERRRQEANAALAGWSRAWGEALQPVGLGEGASVDEARAVLADFRELEVKRRDAAQLRRRIDGMERDARQLGEDVRALAEQHAPDLVDESVEPAADEILRRFRKARTASEELERQKRALAAKSAAVEQARDRLRRAEAVLEDLMREAHVDSIEALEQADERSRQKRALEEELARVEADLREAGGGVGLDELVALASGVNVDEARAEVARLADEVMTLNDEVDELSRTLGQLDMAERNFEQRPGAFAAAGDVESYVAEARAYAQQYARLRLAAVLLEQEIERYRQENQGPILARANEIFPRLTLGEFRELKVDVGGDRAELRCIRVTGEEVEIDGLSDGTRDQLYLALRLASLERFSQRCEPMPVVLDDIFIHFDDERAQAAFSVLFEVVDRLQVLFFTHHEHLIGVAQEVAPPGKLRVHALERRRHAAIA